MEKEPKRVEVKQEDKWDLESMYPTIKDWNDDYEKVQKLEKELQYQNTILEKRYIVSIDEEDTNLEVLEKICFARKYLVRGGDCDYDRGCYAIISDFKQGKLGNITLESIDELKKLMKKDRKETNNA